MCRLAQCWSLFFFFFLLAHFFESYHPLYTNAMALDMHCQLLTIEFEVLSAPSSQHPLRKEAGPVCINAPQASQRHLLQGHWLFLDWGWITLPRWEDPSDRKSPSTPPRSSCILGPGPDRLNADDDSGCMHRRVRNLNINSDLAVEVMSTTVLNLPSALTIKGHKNYFSQKWEVTFRLVCYLSADAYSVGSFKRTRRLWERKLDGG